MRGSALRKIWVAGLCCVLLACAGPQAQVQKGTEKEDAEPWLIRLYQGPLNHFNAVRRGECPMYPSCSEYAAEAIRVHGPVVGWMMTLDRLMRCGRDETRLAPTVLVNGERKVYDPVSANDFWWDH